jgi:hypothetical protein
MTEIRKNEFMDMLEMNDLLFVEHEHFIHSNIPEIGKITYYPKSDKLQIHKTNKWELGGFNFIKTHLKKITENLYTEDQLIKYSNYVLENSKLEFPKPTLLPKDFFKNN